MLITLLISTSTCNGCVRSGCSFGRDRLMGLGPRSTPPWWDGGGPLTPALGPAPAREGNTARLSWVYLDGYASFTLLGIRERERTNLMIFILTIFFQWDTLDTNEWKRKKSIQQNATKSDNLHYTPKVSLRQMEKTKENKYCCCSTSMEPLAECSLQPDNI